MPLQLDACFVAGQQVTDEAVCAAAFPYYGDARIASGGALAGGIIACALAPLTRAAGVDDAQWQRLQAVFPQGVCDPTRAGRGQVGALPWATYASGAPVALGPAPAAVRCGGLGRRCPDQ